MKCGVCGSLLKTPKPRHEGDRVCGQSCAAKLKHLRAEIDRLSGSALITIPKHEGST